MRGQPELYEILNKLQIEYEYHEHPPVPTIEAALKEWRHLDSGRCKNIFFRNHKGNRHYLVILDHRQQLNIRELEQRLQQGKLTFASDKRLKKWLGVEPGSVSPFGLINDTEKHVHLFIEKSLLNFERLAFHPNVNTASLVISTADLIRFLNDRGNGYELLDLGA
jgi:Ala-tRNA(Pro) deacylase